MTTNGQTAAGVTVPDTQLAREATELIRESASNLTCLHFRRDDWWECPGRDSAVPRAHLLWAASLGNHGLVRTQVLAGLGARPTGLQEHTVRRAGPCE